MSDYFKDFEKTIWHTSGFIKKRMPDLKPYQQQVCRDTLKVIALHLGKPSLSDDERSEIVRAIDEFNLECQGIRSFPGQVTDDIPF